MGKITKWLNDSSYTMPLSPACKMCADGSKMVVLITGLCPAKCFYCPLSSEKTGNDRIFADEWELDDEKDVEKLLKEAKLIEATGAGITGGDPLVVWERTKKYIELLKNHFGSEFHIHLYTSGIKNGEHIKDLVTAGLDEIRFHPLPEHWSDMGESPIADTIKNSIKTGCDVAIEIPVIPDMNDEIFSLIRWAEKIGIKWINLNELEYSETNAEELNKKDYTVKGDISAAVKGSQETAAKVLGMFTQNDFKIGVHYCSSSFKDGIQLRNRIKRRAKNVARQGDVLTDEGTILKGIIESQTKDLGKIMRLLVEDFNVEKKYLHVDKIKKRVEVAPWILEKISKNLVKQGFKCYLVEEYPTADRLEVEKIPLPL